MGKAAVWQNGDVNLMLLNEHCTNIHKNTGKDKNMIESTLKQNVKENVYHW